MKNPFSLLSARGLAKTATLVVVAAGLVGVAITNVPAPADTTLPSLPAKDVAAWTMPLDRYIVVAPEKENYAEQLLQKKCLAASGYTWSVPWQDVAGFDTQPNSGTAADVPKPLTAAQASARGYRAAGDDGISEALWRRFSSTQTTSKTEEKAFDTCLAATRKTLPLTFVQGTSAVISARAIQLATAAVDGARTDPTVVATESKWRDCMASADLVDPPGSPWEMSSQSIQFGPRAKLSGTTLASAEIGVAEQDVRCQASSGYRAALYAAQYERESRVTADDAKLFATQPSGRDAFDRKVDAVIAELIPPKPRL